MITTKPIHAAVAASINATRRHTGEHWIAFLDRPLAARYVDTIVRAEASDYRLMRRLMRNPRRRAIHGDYRQPGAQPGQAQPAPDRRYSSSEAERLIFERMQNERRHDRHNAARERAGLPPFDYGDFLARRYATGSLLHRARVAIRQSREFFGTAVSQETGAAL